MNSNLLKPALLLLFLTIMMNTMNAQDNESSNQSLNARQQSIAGISALTAVGDIEQLKKQFHQGLDAGLTINEIKEILVHLYAYCGFPRSLNGINTFMAVLDERKTKGIIDVKGKEPEIIADNNNKYEQGRKVLETLTKMHQPKPSPGYGEFAPRIDAFLKEHLFADVFQSNVLTYQQRELATIAALTAMTGVEAQLKAHQKIGMNVGLTQSQLTQVNTLIATLSGKPDVNIEKPVYAKPTDKLIRLAKIEIDTTYIREYRAAIEEHTKAAIAAEPGVLSLYAMYDKNHPGQVTVLEIYANKDAYQAHLKTPHFLKYKNGTLHMVKSLRLIEVDPIAFGLKPDFPEAEKK